ncbi:MAG: FAD-binding oxidoreductase [Thermomicrobiales bacterium]
MRLLLSFVRETGQEIARNRISRRRLLRNGAAATLALGVGIGLNDRSPSRFQASASASAHSSAQSSALEDLRTRLTGTVMLPGDSGYAAASAPANGRYRSILPAAVARCATEADVVTCITWCNENGVSPVGRGGGHSYAGFSTTTGLLIDLRRLNSVQIDQKKGTVVSGGAALNSDYFIALENGPLFLPGGTCFAVGMGGLTLGGGIGYNAHWAGLTCDHLQASRIVTSSGEILDIDPTTNNDLYWACRGGAVGSFGINTSFTYDLVEVPQSKIVFYRYEWRGADAAAAVLSTFDRMLQTAPAALNAVAMAQASEIGSGGPREAIDVMSRGVYIGPIDELREILAPLLAIPGATLKTLEEMTFWDVQRLIDTEETAQHSFGDLSRYAKEPLPERAVAKVVDLLAACSSRSADANGSFWSLGWVGGEVIGSFSRTETAYVHRDALTLLRPTTVWPDDAPTSVGDELNAWTAEVIAAITPFTPDESYQNFPNLSLKNWDQQYYAENFDRLVDVKTKYDPANLFNNPQSIPTRDLIAPDATPVT